MVQKVEMTGEVLGGLVVREGLARATGKPYRMASFKLHVGGGDIVDVSVEPDQEHLIKEGPIVVEVRALGAFNGAPTARLVRVVVPALAAAK